MKLRFVLAATIFSLATAIAPVDAQPPRGFASKVGEPLPAIAGAPAPAGAKGTLVHVFACDSERCGESLPAIEEFVWKPLKDRGLNVVGIGRDADEARLAALSAEMKLTFPLVADPERKLASLFAEKGVGVPRTVLADAEGKIVYQHAGHAPGREAEFRRVAEAVIDGKPLPEVAGAGAADGPVDRQLGARSFVGKPAPEFHVEQWITADPGDTKGKFVMIEFWATWCGPCRMIMPHLDQIAKTHADKLAIKSLSDEDPATVKKFVDKQGFTYPIGVDSKRRTIDAVAPRGIPHGLLVNPEGVVVWQGHPGEFVGDAGEAKLNELLGK